MGLSNIVCAFSRYSSSPFTVEQVEVRYEDGRTELTPNLETQSVTANLAYMEKLGGFQVGIERAAELLEKMGYIVLERGETDLRLEVPLYRSDVLHPCDVAEDLAISFGYNNIQSEIPAVFTIGKQFDLNRMTELLRHEMAAAGYKECLNFALVSLQDNSTGLNLPEDTPMVTIGNAKTIDFQAGRTNLISGLLKTLLSNKKNKLPIELFEVTDVVLRTDNEVGAKNERHLGAIRTNTNGAELSVGKTNPSKPTAPWTTSWLS